VLLESITRLEVVRAEVLTGSVGSLGAGIEMAILAVGGLAWMVTMLKEGIDRPSATICACKAAYCSSKDLASGV